MIARCRSIRPMRTPWSAGRNLFGDLGNWIRRSRITNARFPPIRNMNFSPAGAFLQTSDVRLAAELPVKSLRLKQAVERGDQVCSPAVMLAISDKAEYSASLRAKITPGTISPEFRSHLRFHSTAPSGKIRVGYFSADFHEHATTWLTAGFFEHQDRTRFETTAFSFGPPKRDAMRLRLERAFDRFLDVRGHSDAGISSPPRASTALISPST